MSYEDIRGYMNQKLNQGKRKTLTENEVKAVVDQWTDERSEEELNQEVVQKEIRKLETKLKKYNVPHVGGMEEDKEEGRCRILYNQMNNASTNFVRDIKMEMVHRLNEKYQVDVNLFAEVGNNWTVGANNNFAKWYEQDKEKTYSVAACNEWDKARTSRHQPGGTAIAVRGAMTQYAKSKSKDDRGLGRYCSYVFWANPNHKCRVVVAYNVCNGKPKGLKTQYQQITRYCQDNNIKQDPKELMRRDFAKQCGIWRTAGERLIIVMDANEHTMDGPLRRMLEAEGVDLKEFSHNYYGHEPPHTFIDGKIPIDAGYKTPDVEVTAFLMLSFMESPGDHRSWLIEVTTRSMLGRDLLKIVRPPGRKLVTTQPRTVKRYNKIVEEQFLRHRIPERLDAVDKLSRVCGNPTPPWLTSMMIKLYSQMDQIRIHAEKQCRNFKTPDAEFSPTIKHWYDRIHAYMDLLKLKQGHKKFTNKGNVRRKARGKGISNPAGLSEEAIRDALRYCKIRARDLRKQAKGLRKSHLRNCLIVAQEKKNKTKVKAIKQIMNREQNVKMWYNIKTVVRDPRSPQVLRVQRVEDGELCEYNTKEEVEQVVQEECNARFTRAHKAPVMKNPLAKRLRYLEDEETARAIIEGTYEIPPELDDATRYILQEIGKMGGKMRKGEGQEIVITKEDYRTFWNRVGEWTTSSPSSIHYGHYKASVKSDLSSKMHAQQLTVIARSGVAPERWGVSLQVLLEKLAGVCLVEKLRQIQLYEADFNFFQQFVFGKEAMNTLTERGLLPEEHFSKKGSTAEDAKFDKTLMADNSRQSRIPMSIVSVDARQCYDRVNHVIMSLVWLALLGLTGPIQALLYCLQTMQFYQRTGHGDSSTFTGGEGFYFMGLGQGSRGAPPSWVCLSSVIVNILRKLKHGARMLDPMTRNLIHSIGAMFVDDTDLYCWVESMKNAEELHDTIQKETTMWGDLLLATGGCLAPDKCFWYMLDYECCEGEWQPRELVDWELMIPVDDGSQRPIFSLSPHESKKVLGVEDCPAGGNADQLRTTKEKVKVWLNRMKNGHLPAKWAWVAYRYQHWPGIRYGIGTMTNDMEEAEELLDEFDYGLLNILGIARTVKKGWRKLHSTFGGFGIMNLATEQLIERLNLLLQHYNTATPISDKLNSSLRYLQLQLGTNKCPLDLDYDDWAHLAPLSWVKMLWRTLQVTGFQLHLKYEELPPPRRGDVVVMELAMEAGLDKEDLMSMSRVKGKLGVIFMSDMTTADGKHLEDYASDPQTPAKSRSKFNFPREEPTCQDWQVWRDFWRQHTVENFQLHTPLGEWMETTHRRWEWFYDEEDDCLQRKMGLKTEYYYTGGTTRTRSKQVYVKLCSKEDEPIGRPASVQEVVGIGAKLRCSGPPLAKKPDDPSNFWEYLSRQGGEWMWTEFIEANKHRDLTWLVEGLQKGTIEWCTDGSYHRSKAPNISGVGWMCCSTETRESMDDTPRVGMKGRFWEKSDSANSYRAEQLGVCAIHHLIAALTSFYKIQNCNTKIWCDNLSAITVSKKKKRRVRPGASCADILRNIRSIRNKTTATIKYGHVDGHTDNYLLWHQMTLEQKMNVICDKEANKAVFKSIECAFQQEGKQLLPGEDVAVFVRGKKLTSDLSKAIRFETGREKAKEFLINECKWSKEQFEEVDWDMLDATLEKKPDMYKMWLSKQHTGFCGTRLQVSYYKGLNGEQSGCPNCGRTETAAHLCLCPDKDRTRLFLESTEELDIWMDKDNKTNDELAFWIPKYILMRGTKRMSEMGHMSSEMMSLARSQDVIGWRNFMEGRVSREFVDMQNIHLRLGCHRINGEQWVRQFISKILHITHSQWIFRNFTLHDKQKGWLRRRELSDIMAEIDKLRETEVDNVPESSRFLLEMDYDKLMLSDIHNKTYWVVATQAAIKAGQRKANQGIRQRTQLSKRPSTSTRERLKITEAEKDIHSIRWAYTANRRGRAAGSSHSKAVINTPSKRKSTSEVVTRTSKRYKPGD